MRQQVCGVSVSNLFSQEQRAGNFGTAMCKTVGYTAAAGAELILRDELHGESGLLLPTNKRIYRPILEATEIEGIEFNDDIEVYNPRV